MKRAAPSKKPIPAANAAERRAFGGSTEHRPMMHELYLRAEAQVRQRRKKSKASDPQPEAGRVFVRDGKGKKDRCTILSPMVWEKIKAYMEVYQPVDWLFEGQDGGAYSDRSIQEFFTSI